MVTLEVYGKSVTWPDYFAEIMMREYRNRGIPCVVLDYSPHMEEKTHTGNDDAGRSRVCFAF